MAEKLLSGYRGNKTGTYHEIPGHMRMDKYEDTEAAKDDYSHERKLAIDGEWEKDHGCESCGQEDFDHAHALKRDAHYDHMNKDSRHPILHHMQHSHHKV